MPAIPILHLINEDQPLEKSTNGRIHDIPLRKVKNTTFCMVAYPELILTEIIGQFTTHDIVYYMQNMLFYASTKIS